MLLEELKNEKDIIKISKKLDIPLAEVYGTYSFYPDLNRKSDDNKKLPNIRGYGIEQLTDVSDEEFSKIMKMSSKNILTRLKKSGLSGRGGANFSTGDKWASIKGNTIFICNADESEPGSFKDRFILENRLKLVMQGMIIAKKVLNADCYLYLRSKYDYLENNIKDMAKNLKLDLKIVVGAGAYICGEETALINSIEGKRGEPRLKPPFPTEKGLNNRPTVVNNVETVANLPLIFRDWKPLRLFSVSGDVKKPGVYEAGNLTLRELLDMAGAENTKAVLFGYYNAIRYEKYKNDKLSDLKLGNCSLIVLNKKRKMYDQLKNVAEFYVAESCGKCLPCREGGYKILELVKKKQFSELKELAEYLNISFCGLGKTYGIMVKSLLDNFKHELK